MPGMEKMFSTTKPPVSTPAAMGPSTVTTGVTELRNACFQMMAGWERPLALAVLM